MTEKQTLLEILERCGDNVAVESVIYQFLQRRGNKYSALRLNRWISDLNNILYDKQLDYERVARISLERANYLKDYLQGKMYKDEEAAKAHIGKQIENATAIIEAVNEV